MESTVLEKFINKRTQLMIISSNNVFVARFNIRVKQI